MCEHLTRSPFAILEDEFQELTKPPTALSVDTSTLGHGLPARTLDLAELRDLLLLPTTSYDARDAAMAVLVRRAQTGTPPDVIGLAGVLLPGLAKVARPLLRLRPDLREDLEAEILTRLLDLIPRLDPAGERLAAWLVHRAVKAGWRLARKEGLQAHDELTVELAETLVEPSIPPPHPDFVLDSAVAAKVVSHHEAELIANTRINGQSVKDLADGSATVSARLFKRRHRAERRLTAWLTCRLSNNSPLRGVVEVRGVTVGRPTPAPGCATTVHRDQSGRRPAPRRPDPSPPPE